MRLSKPLTATALCLSLLVAGMLTTPRKAEAVAPLSYSWWCSAYTYTCTFTVTSTNHTKYYWNFGDGTGLGPRTATTVYHSYSFSGSSATYFVSLSGYATNGSTQPDNIIGCNVTVEYATVGGHPGTSGTCSG
jgi:hypothetical protein